MGTFAPLAFASGRALSPPYEISDSLEALFFQFALHDDLIDACARIYDMAPVALSAWERAEWQPAVQSRTRERRTGILTFVPYSFSIALSSNRRNFIGKALLMTLFGGRSSRECKYFRPKAAGAGGVVAAVLCLGISRAQDVPPNPALLERYGIMTTQKGLDPDNPLDSLVGRLAMACSTEPPLDTRPCPGEKRILTFLRGLPPDQDAIARILEALETTCRKEGPRLDCVYERHVHYDAWAWGYDGPVGSGDNTYRVTFTVTKQGDELQYGIDYHLLTDPK